MGWFSSSPPGPASPKISTDGTPIAPSRSERSRCWEARDDYFKCLDKANIIDSITEKDKAAKACGPESKNFEANCATSWVKYFKQRRVMEDKKEKTLRQLRDEGATELPSGSVPPVGNAPNR